MKAKFSVVLGLMLCLVVPPSVPAQGLQGLPPGSPSSTRNHAIVACTIGNPLVVQEPDLATGSFSDGNCDACGGGVQAIADNMVFTSGVTLNEVVVWGGYFPGVTAPPDDIDVIVHSDAAGLPGAAVATFNNLTSSRALTGSTVQGLNEYRFNITLPTPVPLAGGTYWLEVENNTGGSTESYFWETGVVDAAAGITGLAFDLAAVPGVNWGNSSTFDVGMTVCGSLGVPTLNPVGLLLMTLLLLSLVFFQMRRVNHSRQQAL